MSPASERADRLLAKMTSEEKVALAVHDFEALGEDPCLAGRLAAAEVRAIQDGHVIAVVKHFVGNNAETGRTGYAASGGRTPAINTVVSERTLHELYYPPFKAVVQRGRAGSVMGSYNRVNGVYACQHPGILRTLKDEWGWEGFVAPDFKHAVRDPVAAANAGLDIPGLGVTEGRTAEQFASGAIPAGRLDEIVRRILVAACEREFGQVFDGPPLPASGVAALRAGQPVSIRLDYSSSTAWPVIEPGVGGGNVQLGWQPPDSRIQEAAQLAAASDVAVVLASTAVGEGMDRTSLALPGDQDRLIAAVAEANPRTVVVLNTGGPVLMPWLERAGAVLQAWLPGQQFGEALAAVLFGDADPGGRLPVTFPATPEQGPITGPERWPGTDGDARYDEGVLVGYRWYDAHGQEPLFCFGHGLCYGEYAYGEPRVEHDPASGAVTVTVQVTNTGTRPGSEVVQLYLAAPPAAAQPPRQLKGFAKLRLDPGTTGEAALRLDPGDLAAYDQPSGTWVVHPGRYEVLVGRSSRDIRGSAWIEVEASRGRPAVP